MRQNKKVRSGNQTLVLLDGIEVGLVQSVRMSDDYAPDAASGIGDIHVQEHVPTIARHALSVTKMVLNAEKIRETGITPENGDAVLEGLVFDFVTQDKLTGRVLKTYIGCSYASGDIAVDKHAILMASAQFLALDTRGTGI